VTDLIIKIKTYVYTYVGLFSSKLKLINSSTQLSRVNQDTCSDACLTFLWQALFTASNFGERYFTATNKNSVVDTSPPPIYSNLNFRCNTSTNKRHRLHNRTITWLQQLGHTFDLVLHWF